MKLNKGYEGQSYYNNRKTKLSCSRCNEWKGLCKKGNKRIFNQTRYCKYFKFKVYAANKFHPITKPKRIYDKSIF